MSNSINKPSVRNQASNALDRIAAAERQLAEFGNTLRVVMTSTDRHLRQRDDKLSHLVEIINAMTSLLGAEQVDAAIVAERMRVAAENAEAQKAGLQKGIAEGKFREVQAIEVPTLDDQGKPSGSGSWVVATEFDADGHEIHPGWFCMRVVEMPLYAWEKLAGKGPGFEMETIEMGADGKQNVDPDGKPRVGKFVVRQVLEVVVPATPPTQEAPGDASPPVLVTSPPTLVAVPPTPTPTPVQAEG